MAAYGRKLDFTQSTTTTSNSAVGILDIPTSTNSSASLIVWIVVRRLSDGASQGWTFQGAYKNVNGTVSQQSTLVGSIQGASADKTALSACVVAATTSGASLRITGQGLAATNMIWTIMVQGIELVDQ